MDVSLVIRQRLLDLGLEQKDLARAARVTESYVSQLLSRKRAPPAPNRTDIYDRMNKVLKLPAGELARLVDLQRKEELKRELGDEAAPLLGEVRELLLRKCRPETARHVRAAFEQQAFGELEQFVTQKLLDVARRSSAPEFRDADVFHLSAQHCEHLDSLIESWDIDLATFSLDVVLNQGAKPGGRLRFEFVERAAGDDAKVEPGLTAFLADQTLSRSATPEEIELLRQLRFRGRHPTALYYYRELQSLRDPLHFGQG